MLPNVRQSILEFLLQKIELSLRSFEISFSNDNFFQLNELYPQRIDLNILIVVFGEHFSMGRDLLFRHRLFRLILCTSKSASSAFFVSLGAIHDLVYIVSIDCMEREPAIDILLAPTIK